MAAGVQTVELPDKLARTVTLNSITSIGAVHDLYQIIHKMTEYQTPTGQLALQFGRIRDETRLAHAAVIENTSYIKSYSEI